MIKVQEEIEKEGAGGGTALRGARGAKVDRLDGLMETGRAAGNLCMFDRSGLTILKQPSQSFGL